MRTFLGIAQSGYFEATLQLYLAEAPYSLSPTLFGVLQCGVYLGAGMLALLVIVPFLEKWHGAPVTIVGGFLLTALGATLMGLPTLSSQAVPRHLLLFVTGYVVLGVGTACSMIVAPSLTMSILGAHAYEATTPALVGATATLYVFANCFGWGIGVVVGSTFTQAKGFEIAALMSAMVCLVVAPVLVLFLLPCCAGDFRKKQEKENAKDSYSYA